MIGKCLYNGLKYVNKPGYDVPDYKRCKGRPTLRYIDYAQKDFIHTIPVTKNKIPQKERFVNQY